MFPSWGSACALRIDPGLQNRSGSSVTPGVSTPRSGAWRRPVRPGRDAKWGLSPIKLAGCTFQPDRASLALSHAHAPGVAALAAAAVAAITLSVTALGTPASAASTTAASVIKEAKAAIAAQPSAHLEFDAGSSSSSSTEKIVADVGTNQGTETVTDGSAVLHVVATPSDSYISGSATGLTSLFGMTSAEATKVGTALGVLEEGHDPVQEPHLRRLGALAGEPAPEEQGHQAGDAGIGLRAHVDERRLELHAEAEQHPDHRGQGEHAAGR